MQVTNEVLKGLKKRIPFKWRIQQHNETRGTAVAYIDSRSAQDLLDEVVGSDNWQTTFEVVNGNLFCSVGIRVTHDDGISEWIWKRDCGTESREEKEKGEASDSFKRACVHFGIGRFLYDMDLQKVRTTKHSNGKIYPVNDSGTILWSSDDLTEYINQKIKAGDRLTEERAERYEKPTETPQYTTPNKPKWSKTIQERAAKLEKDGLKGSQLLAKHLPKFNEIMKTAYKTISELDTDEKLGMLIEYVENVPPAGLV